MMSYKTLPSIPVPHYNYYNPINYSSTNWMPTYIPTAYDYNMYYDYMNSIKCNTRVADTPLTTSSPPSYSSISPASSLSSVYHESATTQRYSAFYEYNSPTVPMSNHHDSIFTGEKTPPRNLNTERTSSVIMKVENETIFEVTRPNSIEISSNTSEYSSSSSRSSSSRGCSSGSDIEEYICEWIDCHR